MAGIANLFTKEFYEICAKKLKKGGLVCQWLQGYSLSPSDFQMVVKTFRTVFPWVSVWSTTRATDYLLIGSFHNITLDPQVIDGKIKRPEILDDLKSMNVDNAFSLLSCLVLLPDGVNDFVKDGLVNTDDRPILEFSAPRSLYVQTSNLNDEYLRRFQPPMFSELPVLQQALISG